MLCKTGRVCAGWQNTYTKKRRNKKREQIGKHTNIKKTQILINATAKLYLSSASFEFIFIEEKVTASLSDIP